MANQNEWQEFEERKVANNNSLSARLGFFLQRKARGYDDRDVWDLGHAITTFVYPRLKHFITWQAEYGKRVPQEFINDPAEWLNVLRKIERAFDIVVVGDYRSDTAKAEVGEGLSLFARYYLDLWG